MSLLGLCQSISFIQYKNYQKSLYEILESAFSFLVLFVIFSLALLLCHTERKRSIYVFGIFFFLLRGRGLNLQVWISAYAQMRSRSLPLINPPPLQRFKWRHFVRFNFMVAKSCFATLAIVESALDSRIHRINVAHKVCNPYSRLLRGA